MRIMDPQNLKSALSGKLGKSLLDYQVLNGKRVLMQVPKGQLIEAASFLYQDQRMRFITASAMDVVGGYEIIYHFSDDSSGLIVNLKVALEGEKAQVESLARVFKSAEWIEREIQELFGIEFLNSPHKEKFLLAEDWAAGQYPLRRSYQKKLEKN